jgi:hypothetical protein
LYKLLNAYRKDLAFANIFDASLMFSIASLFYAPNLILILTISIGLLLLRPVIWREWFIAIIGIILPYIFILTYYFINDKLVDFWNTKMSYLIIDIEQPNSLWFIAMIIVFLIISIFVFGKLITSLTGTNQKRIKAFTLLLWVTIFSLLTLIIIPVTTYKSYTLLAIPLSVFFANYFYSIKKNWWAELLFSLMVIVVMLNLFSNYF